MSKKKKRTKKKKKSGSETKARRAQKAKDSKDEVKESTKAAEEAAEASDDDEGDEEPAKKEAKKEAKEEKAPAKKEQKKAKSKEPSKTAALLSTAQSDFENGRYRSARATLNSLLDANPSPEEKEQAKELLGNMEMDVRTLMVGAVAMVTLLLIPTLGYHQFAKALWTIPVLFLLLIVDPRLFRSPDPSEEN